MENGMSMMNGEGHERSRSPSPGFTRSGSRNSLGRESRTSLLRRNQSLSAKQIRFYRNGDKFFGGLKLAVSAERYREFDTLLAELSEKLDLSTGAVRYIFNAETGKSVRDVSELQYGYNYVCSSSSSFRDVENGYGRSAPQWSVAHHSKNEASSGGPKLEQGPKDFIKPKLVTVIKSGKQPQKKVTMLLNSKTALSLDQVLDHLSSKGTIGKVDKLFTTDGAQVKELRHLFNDDTVFIALSSSEKFPEEGFDIDVQSHKITPYRELKRPCGLKRSSSLRTPRRSAGNDGGSAPTPQRPVRRSSSVKSVGKERGVSPASSTNRVNGHTPRSTRRSSAGTTGKKTPNGQAANEELYPAQVFERDASDSGKDLKKRRRERISIHGFYRIGRIIGDGNFAIVRECKHRKTNKEYALKIISKAKVKGKEHMVENEIRIMRQVRHPNIVELLEEYETPKEIFLVLELVKGGDLFEAIVKATKYTERDASHMIRDLASALDYLHRLNIVHRDIKPENLLVVERPSSIKSLKLADFGLAAEVKSPLFLVCGTPTYVAPEILDESGYGLKVDVWAAGVICYILLCGFPPFRSSNQEDLFDMILTGEFEYLSPFWNDISESVKELIDNMLVVDVNKRFSADQILSHPWIKGNTAGTKDIHVNLQTEINKNFDNRRRMRGAAIAVRTVNNVQHTRPRARRVVSRKVTFPEEVLCHGPEISERDKMDLFGSDLDLERSHMSWKAFEEISEGEFPHRRQSNPDIHSSWAREKYFNSKNHRHKLGHVSFSDAYICSMKLNAEQILKSLLRLSQTQPKRKWSESMEDGVPQRKRSITCRAQAKDGTTIQTFPMPTILNPNAVNFGQFVTRDIVLSQD